MAGYGCSGDDETRVLPRSTDAGTDSSGGGRDASKESGAEDARDSSNATDVTDTSMSFDASDAATDNDVGDASAGDAASDGAQSDAPDGSMANEAGEGGDADAADAGSLDASDAPADADDADAPGRVDGAVDAGAACIGNVVIDFASLSPYFVNGSTTCGSASVAGNALVLQHNGTCSQTLGGVVRLDSSRYQICGDFDIRVDFDLKVFSIPTSISRFAVVHAFAPNPTNGIALERYNIAATYSCVSARETYKAWTSNSTDCSSTFRPSSDRTGTFRFTRVGTTVTAYYFASADAGVADAGEDAGGGALWVPIRSATTVSTPWGLEFYTGYSANGGDPAPQTVHFSNLRIISSSSP